MKRTTRILAASVLMALAPVASAADDEGLMKGPAPRIAATFVNLTGSQQSSLALVNALRTGTTVTILTAPPCPAPCTTPPPPIETEFTPVTKPMGWGNVSHSLALAQHSLARLGITNPTPEQLAAALNGGTVTSADGTTTDLRGILQMRADGMGWGNIAKTEGTSLGAVNKQVHPWKTPVATTSTTTTATNTTSPSSVTPPKSGITTAAGASAMATGAGKDKGITTATGTSAGTSSRGIVTASGGGHGHGQSALGRGVVTAGGGSVGSGVASASTGHGHGHGQGAGVVTAGGGAAASVTTSVSTGNGQGHGNGNASGHGKGKGN